MKYLVRHPNKYTDKPLTMKVVGRKHTAKGLSAASDFFDMVIKLRGNKPFIPKGVHRFKSFEDSQQWTMKMLTR